VIGRSLAACAISREEGVVVATPGLLSTRPDLGYV